jgi:glycosyltransferase involved in cell wall biosynthesis
VRLIICSKSAWEPSIRREHAVARSAVADGLPVTFVERPLDARRLRDARTRRDWLAAARGRGREIDGVDVMAQATLVPGHLGALAQTLDALRLARALGRVPRASEAVLVATQPWQWPAVARAPAARRVFDCADDWARLIPGRAAAIDRLTRRIAQEADAVIVVSDALGTSFPGGRLSVVANGVDPGLAATPRQPPPEARRLVYAGTLSERFDAPLLEAVLDRLPGWELELYGQCQYAGRGERPDPELERLLARHAGRVSWRGPVPRDRLVGALDRARVLIAPHRTGMSRGQDSMKLYDYAARGRPIVCTPGALGSSELIADTPVREAAGAEAFARAVEVASEEADGVVVPAAWLERHGWLRRWAEWRRAALGDAPA